MTLTARFLSVFGDARVIAKGEAAGLKLVAKSADPNFVRGTYEPPIQQAIAANLAPGDAFFDIGANIGFFSLIAARRVGPRGQVYAFEPVPRNAAAVAESARLSGFDTIRVFAEAAGAISGRGQLLLAHHIGGAALASAGAPPDMSGRLEVSIVAIDDAIAQRGLRPPSLVKIDVEGAEIDVLAGMTETLRRHGPKVIYEVDDATREGLDRKARKIAELLTAAGYALKPLPASYGNGEWRVEHVLAQPVGA
ncbi:MAG: FkbM family methyltransferase [Mesorhizobium sp.]|uniref:FkbM family methyltransferase n=1 Tax=Mesorhizobium sp. TaxID=1871066 RepID=UPI000FEA2A08|nr:FkbM family methyltransferase [Mesorhizobium sp.]RWP46009.1 MAG: FkbM family methyltransferase [Mesorhizobium sp.]TIM79400.1 MAG: FkbM family methyltransferase [Mesorhizobium sp.]